MSSYHFHDGDGNTFSEWDLEERYVEMLDDVFGVVKGQCCECCLAWIANGDDSGCRDRHGHAYQAPRDAWLIAGDDEEPSDGFCWLCDGFTGYQDVYTFYVVR